MSSKYVLADFNDEELGFHRSSTQLLLQIATPPSSAVPSDSLEVVPGDVIRAIRSFPSGCGGNPDKLHLQCLSYLLISALVDICSMVFEGCTPVEVRPLFSSFSDKNNELYTKKLDGSMYVFVGVVTIDGHRCLML